MMSSIIALKGKGTLAVKRRADGIGLVRIEAKNLEGALAIIRQRFGDEAGVVHTRVLRRSGFRGLLGSTSVEVFVSDRESIDAWRRDSFEELQIPSPEKNVRREPQEKSSSLKLILEKVEARVAEVSRGRQEEDPESPEESPQELAHPEESIEEKNDDLPKLIASIDSFLDENGFSRECRRWILEEARRLSPSEGGVDEDELNLLARLHVGEILRPQLPPVFPISPGKAGRPNVVALVGPTGVGKTTTIAKLAAPFHLVEGRKVGFITLDTYRIGAVDQLQRYADILGVPLRVVGPGEEISESLEALSDRELIFVDTAGRSQKDASRVTQLRDSLKEIGDLEIHLCLSLASSRDSILGAVNAFRVVNYDSLIITKLDEAYRHGILVDVFKEAKKPVSYITCGQEVPDDIRPATQQGLESLILGGR